MILLRSMIIVRGWIIVSKLIILIITVFMAGIFIYPALAVNTGTWDFKNLMSPAWNNLQSYWGDQGNTERVQGMFYTVVPWEIQACQAGVTSDLQPQDPSGFAGSQTSLENIYGLTITLNIYKTVYSANESLYEMSWYVQPQNNAITYTIYFKTTDGVRQDISTLKNLNADPAQGDAGYYTFYSDQNYTKAFIESGTPKTVIFKTVVVQKTTQ